MNFVIVRHPEFGDLYGIPYPVKSKADAKKIATRFSWTYEAFDNEVKVITLAELKKRVDNLENAICKGASYWKLTDDELDYFLDRLEKPKREKKSAGRNTGAVLD